MELETMGKFLAKLRKEKGLTQVALGEILKVENKVISKWERGRYAPDISVMKELCNFFEITPFELLEGKRYIDSIKEEQIANINEKNKYKKYLIFLTIIFFIMIIIYSLILLNIKTNNWNIDKITETNSLNYNIQGVILYNKKESIYIIKEIGYRDENNETKLNTKINYLKVSLLLDNKVINIIENKYIKPIDFSIALKNINMYIENNKIIYEPNNLNIQIEYEEKNNDYHNVILSIK